MGYELHAGLRLEDLVDGHQDLFRGTLFGPQPMVVLQNQSLAQWLKLRLARNLGAYATGDLLFQDEALRRLLDASAAGPDRILFLDELKFALYRRLAEALVPGGDAVFAPLVARGYPDPTRLFELADHVAGVFHNYAMNSNLWPAALASGRLPSGPGAPGADADPRAFAWQSRLWRDLLTGDSGTLAGLALEALTKAPPASWGDKPSVVLVGSAFLSRRAAAFLRAWADAELIDVVHLLLLPAPAPASGWPDARPWSSWGAFGRAFLELLPTVGPGSPAAGPATEPPTALAALQAGLAQGRPFAGAPDETLVVTSSPHPLRELELLRDRLLAALDADPTLDVNEIAVLAPDINVYAPFLDAAFGSDDPGRRLKFHVIDLDLGKENRWFRALDALLSLVSGHIDRPNLFALVDTPAFAEAWDLGPDEQELWLEFTEEVSAWREDGSSQSWTLGWDRLFEGWFRSDGTDPFRPPVDASPSAFQSLGRFHALLEGLKARGHETRRPAPFLDWVRFLDGLTSQFLGTGDGTAAVLSGRLRTLALDAGSPEDPLPWTGFRAFVQDQIAHFPGRRGQLLTEGVHCSSLRPLRAIPFRIIAVLGLDEGRFPRQTPSPSFDLRRHEPGQAEVSALALDKYCFWETIMAARGRLILSYQGRSAVDGTERPPSPVLADLLDYLEVGGTPWPVAEGTVKDFSVLAGAPPTWSPRTQRRARALAEASRGVGPGPGPDDRGQGSGAVGAEAFPEVRTSEVVEAFVTPARFHLKRVRQVVLRDEDRRGVDDEEPWSLDFFGRHAWLQEGLRRHWAGLEAPWNVDELVARAVATGQVREGAFADRDRRELARRAEGVRRWADELGNQGWVPAPGTGTRTLWAGRPWAPEASDRLARGSHVLIPRLLFTDKIAVRTKVEVAVRVLLEPAPGVVLATLNPSGEAGRLEWSLDPDHTAALARRAEDYFTETASRPLALYPDFVAALAKARSDLDSWEEAVDRAWREAQKTGGTKSESTLGRDPYAALAFPDDQAPPGLVDDARRWWDDLWVPLLEAWS